MRKLKFLFAVVILSSITGCINKKYKECRGIDSCNRYINSIKNEDFRMGMLDTIGKQTDNEFLKWSDALDKMEKLNKMMNDIK